MVFLAKQSHAIQVGEGRCVLYGPGKEESV